MKKQILLTLACLGIVGYTKAIIIDYIDNEIAIGKNANDEQIIFVDGKTNCLESSIFPWDYKNCKTLERLHKEYQEKSQCQKVKTLVFTANGKEIVEQNLYYKKLVATAFGIFAFDKTKEKTTPEVVYFDEKGCRDEFGNCLSNQECGDLTLKDIEGLKAYSIALKSVEDLNNSTFNATVQQLKEDIKNFTERTSK